MSALAAKQKVGGFTKIKLATIALLTGLFLVMAAPIASAQEDNASGIFDLGGNTSDEAADQIEEQADAPAPWSFLPGIPNEGSARENIDSILAAAALIVRLALGSAALIMGTIATVRLIASRGQEEEYKKASQTLIFSVGGLALVALSGDLAALLSPEGGGLLGANETESRALLYDNTVRIAITFIKYFAAAAAVAMLVRIGFRLVTLSQADDELSQDKRNIGLIIMGLVVLVFGDSLITNVFYIVDSPLATEKPSIDLSAAMQELIGFTNLIVTIVGPIAVASFVAGGLMYVLSGINEELRDRGRKMMTVSLFGIILLYAAFGIVNTIIVGQF